MIFLNVREVLSKIDLEMGYYFEGKDSNDNLIKRKTWNKYVDHYRDELEFSDDNPYAEEVDLSDKMVGKNKARTYREDFVEEVIEYKNDNLLKQLERKTIGNPFQISTKKELESLGYKLGKGFKIDRIPITQSEMMKNEMELRAEEIKMARDFLIKEIASQLIDMNKFNNDVYTLATTNEAYEGIAYPKVAVEDETGQLLGFEIDARKYLKEKMISSILSDNDNY